MEHELAQTNPCRLCGNDFIEIFGGDGPGFVATIGEPRWWCGCKPCSKHDEGQEHVTARTRNEAVRKWNELNPRSADSADEGSSKGVTGQ